jgi:tetratricopeptide (TPR) repeat protein
VSDDVVREFRKIFAKPGADVLGIGIDLLLESLPPEEAQHVRLAAIPHMFTPALLQVMEQSLSTNAASSAYEQLSSLAIVTPAPGGRSLHDRARKYLFRQWLRPAAAAEFSDINKRLRVYYAAIDMESARDTQASHRNHRIFHALGADLTEGMIEFESAFREERRRGALSACRTLLNLAHEYDAVLGPGHAAILAYHEGRLAAALLEWDAAETHFNKVLVSQSTGEHLKAKARMQLGLVHRERHELDEAIVELAAVVEEAELNPELKELRPAVLRELGSTWRDTRDYEKAEKLIRASIDLATESKRPYELAASWNSLGTLHARRGDNAAAIEAYKRALHPLEEMRDRLRQAQVLNNLGQVYSDAGSTDEAERIFEDSLRIRLEAGDTRGRGLTTESLARHYDRQGDFERADKLYDEAILLLEDVHDFQAAGLAASNFGKMYRRRGLNKLALARFQRAIDIFGRGNYRQRVDEVQAEIAGMGRSESIPWWAWLSIGLALLLVLIVLVLILIVVVMR